MEEGEVSTIRWPDEAYHSHALDMTSAQDSARMAFLGTTALPADRQSRLSSFWKRISPSALQRGLYPSYLGHCTKASSV